MEGNSKLRGRKIIRTVTAPTVINAVDRKRLLSRDRYSPHKGQLYDNQTLSLSEVNGQNQSTSIGSTPLLVGSFARKEVCSTYMMTQTLKDTLKSITRPNQTQQHRHSREVIRCWSRERVIRSESIISIKKPRADGSHEVFTISSDDLSQSNNALAVRRLDAGTFSPGRINSSLSLSNSSYNIGKLVPIKTTSPVLTVEYVDNGEKNLHPVPNEEMDFTEEIPEFLSATREKLENCTSYALV